MFSSTFFNVLTCGFSVLNYFLFSPHRREICFKVKGLAVGPVPLDNWLIFPCYASIPYR